MQRCHSTVRHCIIGNNRPTVVGPADLLKNALTTDEDITPGAVGMVQIVQVPIFLHYSAMPGTAEIFVVFQNRVLVIFFLGAEQIFGAGNAGFVIALLIAASAGRIGGDRKSTRLNSSPYCAS